MIRSSDNAAAAKERLIDIFDLSEVQADYILDMPLRRLTKFSKLELDKEKAELERTIEALDAILGDEKMLRKVVSDELAEVAKTYGTPRRTVLLASAGATVDGRGAAARGGRRPVLRLPLLQRAAGPVGATPSVPGQGEGARQPRRHRLRGPHDGARRGRRR